MEITDVYFFFFKEELHHDFNSLENFAKFWLQVNKNF